MRAVKGFDARGQCTLLLMLPIEEALKQMADKFEDMLVTESLNEIVELNL